LGTSRLSDRVVWLVGLPFRLLSDAFDLVLSPRGLALTFLLVSALLVSAGWYRPPLSPNVRSYHIPLGLWKNLEPPPDLIVRGPRQISVDSIGVLLTVLIVAVGVVLLWRPRYVGAVAGILLAACLAGNMAAAFNHPGAVELMDREYEHRQQIVGMITSSPGDYAVANTGNGRIGPEGDPGIDEFRGDLRRGWVYLLYGRWLVLWIAAAHLLGSTGALRCRLGTLAVWTVAGLVIGGLVCSRRLHGEYYWYCAKHLEARGDFAAAQRALETAVTLYPEFHRLERTWLLSGKLDYRTARPSDRASYFRAYQLYRDKQQPRAVTYLQDLPWQINGAYDSRQGLVSPLVGYCQTDDPRASSTLYTWLGLPPPQGPYSLTYLYGLDREPREARALMKDLLAQDGGRYSAVRAQTGRMWTDFGLKNYLQAPELLDTGPNFFNQDQQLITAAEAWRRAAEEGPGNRDTALYLGMVQARVARDLPVLAQGEFTPLQTRFADRVLRAEIQATLGDTLFDAGELTKARGHYAESYDLFTLPTIVNFRAQRSLGGL
jgi:tetratricopeptide (TPR) repeat protein